MALLVVAGHSLLNGASAAAAAEYKKDNCPNAPGSNWGNRQLNGAHVGAMATITVRAMSNDGQPINTSYRLNSKNSTGGNLFKYSELGKGGGKECK